MKVLPIFISEKRTKIPFLKALLFSTVLLFTASYSLNAQTILLKRDTEKDTVERKFGKNKKFYANFLIGYGFLVGSETPGLPIQYGNSSELVLGVWGKRKLNNRFSIVPELNFRAQWFRIAQNDKKAVPDKQLYELERYTFPTLNPVLSLRTQLKPHKGNHFGTYLDLGVGLNVPFWARHRRVYEDKATGNEVVEIRKNLSYIQPVQLTANARLGYKRWNVYATYRLTDIFKKDKGQEIFNQTIDLPKIMIGAMFML